MPGPPLRSVVTTLILAAVCAPLATGCAHVLRARVAHPDPAVASKSQAMVLDEGRSIDECFATVTGSGTRPVRSLDPAIGALLQSGCQRSPTLRRLSEEIGRTNGIIYIEAGSCPYQRLRACMLHSMYEAGTNRYLWIRVAVEGKADAVAATIAHELQHALEVLQHAWIRSRWDVIQFYRSADSRAFSSRADGPFQSYETPAAIGRAAAVSAELAATTATTETAGVRDHP